MAAQYVSKENLDYFWKKIKVLLDGKVSTVNGKGLSTNDYITADKNKLAGIAAGAEVNVQSDWNVTDSTSDAYIKNKPTIPTVNNGTLTIQKNGTNVATFTANQSGNSIANLIIPTSASDVSALPDSTKYGASLSLTMNTTTYVLTAQLKDQSGNNLGTAQTIDLPLESVVVSGSYDKSTKKVVLTLKDGSTVDFSVADLVSGLVPDTRKVNGKALSSDITLSASDVGALPLSGGTLTGTVSMSNGDFLARYVGISAVGHETGTYDKIAIISNTTNGYVRYRTKAELKADLGVPTDYATKEEGVYFVDGTGNTTAGTWTGTNSRITSYYDGLVVNFKIGVAGADPTTLNINDLGAKPCYLRGTTKVTTHYAVGTIVMFSYSADTDAFYSSDYDANNYAYVRQYGNVTTNAEYPMLFSYTKDVPSTYATRYASSQAGFTFNPSTKTLTATNIKGTTIYQNGKQVANKDDIPSLDGVVKTTGSQTVAGTKTFSDGILLGSSTERSTSTGSIELNGDVLTNPNLNDITQRGIYHCTKGTNTPSFDQTNSTYDLLVFNSSEYDTNGAGSALVTQIVILGWKWWIRRKDSSTWGAWERFGQSIDASKYLPLSGGTIAAGKTITFGGTSNATGANIKWATVSSKTPYIGYCTGSGDATFVVSSLTGTTYQTGLAIGGSSGNLLWKGNKVATTADLGTQATFSLSGTTLTITPK